MVRAEHKSHKVWRVVRSRRRDARPVARLSSCFKYRVGSFDSGLRIVDGIFNSEFQMSKARMRDRRAPPSDISPGGTNHSPAFFSLSFHSLSIPSLTSPHESLFSRERIMRLLTLVLIALLPVASLARSHHHVSRQYHPSRRHNAARDTKYTLQTQHQGATFFE